MLYSNIPVSDVAAMTQPIQKLTNAIEAKHGAEFVKSFNELTFGCNSCHQQMGRPFIVVQTPTVSPFSDQLFTPKE
jgi:hypothetical protein